MKAKQWAEKFDAVVNDDELGGLLTEYALETRDLVDARSKTSHSDRKAAAAEGALREQRQKWLAVCNQVKTLAISPVMFDTMLVKDLNDVHTLVHNYKNPKVVPAAERKQEDVVDGRRLAASLL